MSNAIWVAWRIPCSGLRLSSVLPPATFRPVCRDLRITPSLYNSTPRRLYSSLNTLCQTQNRPNTLRFFPRYSAPTLPQSRSKKTAAPAHSEPTSDSLLDKSLSDLEIKAIFGHRTKVSPKLANRTLEVLQARRLEGTLDLDLPLDVARAVPQSQLDICLEWLRVNYPVDEDAAIMARIEREDREAEEKLVRRAERLGLYKPQSGSYEAELGEEDSPYGKSVLKEAREQNEKYLLAEKERKRQKWLDGEKEEQEKLQRQLEENTSLQQYQESALTEARPRADPNERPYLAWVQKHHIAGTLDHPEAMEVTTAQRLVAPALFVLLTLGLCYYLATTYEPPARKDRLWPDIPPAAATVGAIIGANVAVTLMWKYIPPSWRLLNRFFVIVPFYPSAPSMIGSTFSHQTWRHLATNMMVLGLMGTRVHDELGRGNFLAIYFASGALGSLASLSRSVLLGYLGMTSLGASAATSGIVAAWCMYHANDKITMWILPHELRETLWTQGWIFLACLVATEVFSMVAPARFMGVFPLSRLTKMDHAAHLGGYFAGAGCGYALAQRRKAERVQRARDAKWFENLVR
ncbi:uncharacterized protein N7443_009674 [Penicillium atrosanguineum]|uniref:Peptidase S54 rhomboid domain-containing protein n=1 Tax=Penicillium atrosanguineum TaxID=1132637 RepID=A0A9W9U341_9EURO|nr:uncharacterized protein N7443_009674 [Penicillium atrosanguineum]KAJ5289421.1 hypothetical protein N7443_009674 [Penicillium atrosanguineum]KAJ5307236.1 hypothetical protein N7476_007892 [Penicillium atrosanguineum]